ncbi:MAG: glycosyltransferase family 4 protein [Acidimicrobiales bacterium]
MRVGMICPYSMGVWGGVQAQVLGLARSMRARGIDVQVLAPCDGLPPEPWITPLGNSMPYAQNGSYAPVAPDPAAQLRALGAIWDERFDLLHLHEPLAPGPTLTALVVKPVPLVGTFHASGEISVYRYLRPLLRRLVTRLDVRVAVSDEAARMASRHLGSDYEVLFNGIDVARFANAAPAPTGGPTVFFLARHEPRKGLAVLLEASRQLPENVTVWIGGTGPETAALREANADNPRLMWMGPMSEVDKLAAIAAADVFCVPSLGGESFGVVLLEGMAAGTPVVASDIDAYRLTSRNGTDAGLFAVGDADALARAIERALERSPEVVHQIERGRERAQEFSMDRLVDAYLERYERLLG